MLRLNLPQKSSSQPTCPAGAESRRAAVRPAGPLRSHAEHLAGRLLHLRIARAAGDAELRARFHDAQAGGAHVRIHALRLGDQLVEHRVVEVAPPLLQLPHARRAGSAASGSREPPFQSASQGTCGRWKSGPTVVQAPSSPAAASAIARKPESIQGYAGAPTQSAAFGTRSAGTSSGLVSTHHMKIW